MEYGQLPDGDHGPAGEASLGREVGRQDLPRQIVALKRQLIREASVAVSMIEQSLDKRIAALRPEADSALASAEAALRQRLAEIQEGMRSMVALQESQLVKRLRSIEPRVQAAVASAQRLIDDAAGRPLIHNAADTDLAIDVADGVEPPAMGLILHSDDEDEDGHVEASDHEPTALPDDASAHIDHGDDERAEAA